MIIQLKNNITSEQKNQLCEALTSNKYNITEVKTQAENYLVCIGKKEIGFERFVN